MSETIIDMTDTEYIADEPEELALPDPGKGRYWVVEEEEDKWGSLSFNLRLRSKGNDSLDVEDVMFPTATGFHDAALEIIDRMKVSDNWLGEHRFDN